MSMDPRMRPAATRQYEEFDPETSWVSEEGAETLLVHLPGFKKEQLRVQLTPSRLLKISGERLLGANKWQRFMKESRVPPGCDFKEITAKFEGGVLNVRQPKLITPAEPSPAPAPAPAPAPSPAPLPAPSPAPLPAPSPVASPARAEKDNAEEEIGKQDEPEADTRNKNEEESRDKMEFGRKTERVLAERLKSGGGVFKVLKKPQNAKILAVMIVAAIALALHIAYINKVCKKYTTEEL